MLLVSNKVAILALCYLIYTTLARELENMLKPPLNMDEIYQVIDRMSVTGGRMQVSNKNYISLFSVFLVFIYRVADKSFSQHLKLL